ncbi:GLPGLI family protein [Elizabethkingia anophelis]|uniref:GLPGLI family protein n=1 Tax=Elizabethkingia anophelis TaxID=1117645 RepID=UPI0004173755|nr:GLPGLI family protein [Elizabethkingia anophelis]
MKTLQLFIFCISTFYFTQNMRFVYQVRMKIDSTQRDQVKSELANLDIDKTNSVFYAAKAILRDSIMDSNKKSQIGYISKEQSNMMTSNIRYIINKKHKNQEINYIPSVGPDTFSYIEIKPFNWKISTEVKKNWKLQYPKSHNTIWWKRLGNMVYHRGSFSGWAL